MTRHVRQTRPRVLRTIGLIAAPVLVAAACIVVLTHLSAGEPSKSANLPPTTPPTAISSPASATPVRATVLAIGDSVMKGYGIQEGDSWLRLIAKKQNWNLIDRSCNGAGFIRVAVADCKENFPQIIAQAKGDAPDYVIISGSANDFGTNDSQLQVVTDNAITQLSLEFPRATIIGLNVAWGDRTPPHKVAIINSQIAAAMPAVHGVFVDFGTPLLSHPELLQADHLHPLPNGQLALESAIEQALVRNGIVI